MTDAEQVPSNSPRGSTASHAREDSPRATGGLRWRAVHHPFALGFFVTVGGLVALLLAFALSNLSTVIVYVVFALFAALGLDPVVRWLGRRGLSRAWSIVVVFAGFGVVLAAILTLIIPTVVRQITQFVTDVPNLISSFQQSDTYAWMQDQFGDVLGDALSQVQTFLADPGHLATIGGGVLQAGVTIVSGLSGAVIILVLSLYFLASLPTMKKSFYRLIPAYGRDRVSDLTEQITDSIGGYLMGMVILALCNATFVFIVFLVLGLPFPLLIAVATFCITLIPLVGTVLMWVIASVVALFANPMSALIFAIVYLIYMQVEAYVLTPRIMNRTISIPGALVVIGALVGGTLLGLLGALVAIPVTASALLVITQVLIPRQDAKTAPDA